MFPVLLFFDLITYNPAIAVVEILQDVAGNSSWKQSMQSTEWPFYGTAANGYGVFTWEMVFLPLAVPIRILKVQARYPSWDCYKRERLIEQVREAESKALLLRPMELGLLVGAQFIPGGFWENYKTVIQTNIGFYQVCGDVGSVTIGARVWQIGNALHMDGKKVTYDLA